MARELYCNYYWSKEKKTRKHVLLKIFQLENENATKKGFSY